MFNPLVHFPDAHNIGCEEGQRKEPGTPSRLPMWEAGTHELELLLTINPGALAEMQRNHRMSVSQIGT